MATETRRIQFDFIARDRGVGRQMQETGKAADDMNAGMEGGAGKAGKLGGAMAKLGPIAAGVGAAIGVLGPIIAKGLDAQEATAKFQAQLGLTAKESGRIGGVAGKLYSSAYGESMEEVRGAITQVIRNMDGMREASSADLQATTARAMDLATVMDEDVSRVTVAVSSLMRNGLAKSSKEAFDIMTRGAQMGANKAEDLADTFEEYGVQFKSMGLTGKQAMGLIVQGLQAGGRNADLVADTIKEFSIEAVAGGERVKKGFAGIGVDANKMSQAFAKGGPGAAKALDLVLDRLRAIKDPVKRNQVAIDLFGTKAEDMGKALFALDPSKAVKGLGNLAGATDRAGKAMGETFKARITALKRTLETQLTVAAGKALGALAKLGGELRKGFKMPPSGKASNDMQRLGQMARQVADAFKARVVPAAKAVFEWFSTKILPVIVKLHREVLKEAIKQIQRIGKELGKNEADWKGIAKAVGKVIEVLYKVLAPILTMMYKVYLKLLGTAIVLLIKHLGVWLAVGRRVWKDISAGGKIIATWAKGVSKNFTGVRDTATKALRTLVSNYLNFVSTLIKGAAKAFGWVPGVGPKLRSAAKEFDSFKDRVNASLNKIGNKTTRVTVKANGTWTEQRAASHSYYGGPITGKGQPGASRLRDSVHGLLRVDEHVWTPEEVDSVGGHKQMFKLRAMAKKGLLKFADGGPVGRGVHVSPQFPSSSEMHNTTYKPIIAGINKMIRDIIKWLAKTFGGAGGVVGAARSQIGYPYSWGGGGKGGPSYGIGRGAGTYGYDCSGLTEYAWWKGARKSIGGTTYEQWPNSRPTGRKPGALGFPHMGHVVIASDKPGYIIQAPFTGSHVQEVSSGRGYSWRWPFYSGGPVGQAGAKALRGPDRMVKTAQALGIIGNPQRHRAGGGPVTGGRPYVVGELGPEVMVPRATGNVRPGGATVVTIEHLELKFADDRNMVEKGREFAEGLTEYARRGGRIPISKAVV